MRSATAKKPLETRLLRAVPTVSRSSSNGVRNCRSGIRR